MLTLSPNILSSSRLYEYRRCLHCIRLKKGQNILQYIQVANERWFVLVVLLNDPKILERSSEFARIQRRHCHFRTQLSTHERQAVVAFAFELAFLQGANDLGRSRVRPMINQMFPRNVWHTTAALHVARVCKVLLKPLRARVTRSCKLLIRAPYVVFLKCTLVMEPHVVQNLIPEPM